MFTVRIPFQFSHVGPNQTGSPWWRLHPELARMHKGIVSYDKLAETVAHASRISEDGRARVVTDLRAHMNPTRMKAITTLAANLARRVATECPECGAPGYGRVAPTSGLRCVDCGEESIIPRGDLLMCVACGHELEERRRPIREFAEPGDCPQCNP